jgi:hypothetical protein
MKRRSFLLLCPLPLAAHMMSFSTGEIRIEGTRARYELRMPLYEAAHLRDPERSLLESIRFRSGGALGRAAEKRCRPDAREGAFLCSAAYEFPGEVQTLEIECSFHAVTVPNHVHLLRAVRGDRTDQAVFDFTFQKAVMRFEEPAAWQKALRETFAGAARAAGGLAQLLFLASLVLAARSRHELVLLAAAFLAGETAVCVLAPAFNWQPAPAFVEAAAALTIAYLAVEILLLPQAGRRWLVVGVLGGFHGLYFHVFLNASGYGTLWVLAGMALAELILIAAFALLFSRIGRVFARLQPARIAASGLFLVGITWFFFRMRGG